MISITDYYPQSEYTGYNTLFGTSYVGRGQSFGGNGDVLQYIDLYLFRTGSTTGNVYVKIYAHSGTYGSSSLPTGSAIATSDAFDASTLPTDVSLVRFYFSGANKITLVNTTPYVLTIEYTNDASTYLRVGQDSSGGHAGNESYKEGGTWKISASTDLIFYVYGDTVSASTVVKDIIGGMGIIPFAR